MIKSLYETKVEQIKGFLCSHRDKVLNYRVTSGWVSHNRPVKVLEVLDRYTRVGIVNSKGRVLYTECINYAALNEGYDGVYREE